MSWAGGPINAIAARGKSFQEQAEVERQNKYNAMLFNETVEAATTAALEDFVSLRERAYQERAQAAQEIRGITAESRQAAAGAKLQALESGTGGRSVEMLLADFERSELSSVAVSADNLAATERQLGLEARASVARRNDRIAAARRPLIYGPYNGSLNRAGTFLPHSDGSSVTG